MLSCKYLAFLNSDESMSLFNTCWSLLFCSDKRSDLEIEKLFNNGSYLIKKVYTLSVFWLSKLENSPIKSSNSELNGVLEVLIYNGILNLIILENIETYKENIIKFSNDIYIGCGFDSGETYILGKLTEQGLK